MSSTASLRDLYSAPPTTWSFVPPAPPNASAKAPPLETAYSWSSRPTPNSIYDLTPGLNLEPSAPNARLLLKSLVASALLQYTSTALAMPWEVGRVLLQVQHIPRDAAPDVDAAATADDEHEDEEGDQLEPSDESSGENEDSYFADTAAPQIPRFRASRQTDEQGYVVRPRAADAGTRPDYIIPIGAADGVWGMMKRVGRWKSEGWLSLWKGQLTACSIEFLSATLHPIVQSILSGLLSIIYPSPNNPFTSPHHPLLIPLTAHALTGFLLSPLDLVRTRLIVQSAAPRHKRYTGPLDALSQIARTEGGLRSMYIHPQLLYPALLDCTLRPLAGVAAEHLAARVLGPTYAPDTHPLTWSLAQLAAGCACLLITLPVETVRRRLQVQTRGGAAPLRTCVEVRRRPYVGVVDTVYQVLAEERADLRVKASRRERRRSKGKARDGAEVPNADGEMAEESWFRSTGIAQLYRGLSMRIGGSVIAFVLQSITAGQQLDDGWTEL